MRARHGARAPGGEINVKKDSACEGKRKQFAENQLLAGRIDACLRRGPGRRAALRQPHTTETVYCGLVIGPHLRKTTTHKDSVAPNRRAREHGRAPPPPRALPSSPACQTARERRQQCCSRRLRLHEARSVCSLGSSRHALRLVLGGGRQGSSWQMAENLSAGSASDCTRSKRLLSTTESTAISSSGMPAPAAGPSSSAPARSCRCAQRT